MEERRARRAKVIRLSVVGVISLGLLIVVGRGAYAKTGRVRECMTLAEHINPVLEEIQTLTKKHDGATYRAASERYAKLAVALPGLASRGNAQDVKEYADVLVSTAKALKAGSTALDGKNLAAVEQTRRELERVVRKERTAISKIDAYCRAN